MIEELSMLTTMTINDERGLMNDELRKTGLCRFIILLSSFVFILWLANAVQAQQPRPGQNQVNPQAGATERGKDEPISGWQIALFAGLAVLILVGVIVLVIFFKFIGLFVQCWLTGAQISILDLLWMKLRNVDYAMI